MFYVTSEIRLYVHTIQSALRAEYRGQLYYSGHTPQWSNGYLYIVIGTVAFQEILVQ